MGLKENLELAEVAIMFAVKCTPRGSDNKGDSKGNVKKTRAFRDDLAYGDWDDKLRDKGEGSVSCLTRILQMATAARTIGAGNCQEMAAIAYSTLYQKGVKPIEYMSFLNEDSYDHAWVVIGRPKSATYDLKTWGDDAVWCDPWAAKGGLKFAVSKLVAGEAKIHDHNFHYAIHTMKKGQMLTADVLARGMPAAEHRSG